MSRVLGVDGGQTVIRIRASEDAREIQLDGAGRQDADPTGTVIASVVDGWQRLGEPRLDRVVLGLSTAPADAGSRDRLAGSISRALGVEEVWVADDAVTAHAGALSGRAGVTLVCGTGVACLAMSAAGAPRIIGGHGFLLGDEGGGFWIGRAGLRAALRAADGRAAPTALEAAAERRFGPLADLHVRLHDVMRPVPLIAAFAPEVLEVADRDDVADQIVSEAADELMLLARSGLEWAGAADLPVALGGRLLTPGSALRRRLEDRRANVVVVDPDGSPLDGAIRLGIGGEPGPYGDLIRVWPGSAA